MATEIDHDQNKTKIVAILKANATLFTDSDLTKIRSIDVGFPVGDPFQDQMFDYIFVTNSAPFETIRNDGRAVVSNAITALEHTFSYDIVTVVNGLDARDAEKKLDAFQKLTLETLEADVDLTGVGTADVDVSFPTSIAPFNPPGVEGGPVQGRRITLRCMKATG